MAQKFVPLSVALSQIARDKGYNQIGRRRRVKLQDLTSMTDRQRAVLARDLLNKRAK